MKKIVLAGLMGLAVAGLARAEALNYGLVSLSESVSRPIARDQMVLVLNIEEQGKEREAVANAVTRKVNAVLQQARQHSQFNTTLQSRSAYPQSDYVNGRRVDKGWQDSASIKVESKDMAALNAFAAKVQSQAAISDIQYTVSTASMQANETELTREALQRFNARAAMIAQNLGGSGYKIVQLNIGNSSDNISTPLAYGGVMRAKADAAPVQDSAPGEAQLRLDVSGQIQVQGLR
ncbi:SIMPL domain-containing protein [Paralysiella testudinis]|uniref:SIMPL domain-containing protein n=1 Tax=Paralysiella testudinis TaxID=2809020 RepID=A0A892ZIK5_9NEIS|nr:SIMPL domain-containing protein [Paralysiella testudinis]QRQ80759.1 SIMPL domain-containing protein [Paralysiella testudinis]